MNKCMFAGKICLTDCVWKIAQMVLILLMKNVAVDEGRGVIVISNIVTYYYNINILSDFVFLFLVFPHPYMVLPVSCH